MVYDADYMKSHGFASERPDGDQRRWNAKVRQVGLIRRVTGCESILFAGAAAGAEVLAARSAGLRAEGFDLCDPPYDSELVAVGDFSRPETWPPGDFDCLAAIDLFEHLTIDQAVAAIHGIAERQIPWLAAAIARSSKCYGHVTLHSLSWWCDFFRRHGYLLVAEPAKIEREESGIYGICDFHHCYTRNDQAGVILFWRRR